MAASDEEVSLDGREISELLENSADLTESKNPFKVLREQLRVKEKAVIDQQLALDVKDSNLKDAEQQMREYDQKISVLEAKMR